MISHYIQPPDYGGGEEDWFECSDNVNALARHLVAEEEIVGVEELLYYFSKPWKWQAEWDSWQADCQDAEKAERDA